MTRVQGAQGTMRWAAIIVAISAALHVVALIISGFSAEAWQLLPFGIVYSAFAYGLLSGWRWVAYAAFIALLIGTSVAVSNIWSFGDVPGWLYATIAVANLLSVIALFGTLWRTPQSAN